MSSETGSMVWATNREIQIDSQGKHIIGFNEEFPFELRLYDFASGYRLTPSVHDYVEITYVYQGAGSFFVEQNGAETGEGDLIIVGNSAFHRLESSPNQALKVICLFFLPELIYRAGSNLIDLEFLHAFHRGRPENPIIRASDVDQSVIMNSITAIKAELDEQQPHYRLAIKRHLIEILLFLTRHLSERGGDDSVHEKRHQSLARLEHVFRFLQENYHDSISLEQAAATAYLSPSHFCKVFKKTTGCTLTEYVHRLRIDEAKELLLTEEPTITEIAFQVGYESHSYFDRIFRRLTHLSPHEYQEEARSIASG